MEPTHPAIQQGRGVKLNNRFHLVLRLRTAGAVSCLHAVGREHKRVLQQHKLFAGSCRTLQ
jgi:hypothetical protein